MNMEGTGAGLPKLADISLNRLAPSLCLMMIFSTLRSSPKSGATDSTTLAMYTHGIQCSPSCMRTRWMGFIVRLLGQEKCDALTMDNPRLEKESPLLPRRRTLRALITDSYPFWKSSKRRFFGINEVNQEKRGRNQGLAIRNESAEILSSAISLLEFPIIGRLTCMNRKCIHSARYERGGLQALAASLLRNPEMTPAHLPPPSASTFTSTREVAERVFCPGPPERYQMVARPV